MPELMQVVLGRPPARVAPHPLPDNPEVLKVMLGEAQRWLQVVEPLLTRMRLRQRVLERDLRARAESPSRPGLVAELTAQIDRDIAQLGSPIESLLDHLDLNEEQAARFCRVFPPDRAAGGEPTSEEGSTRLVQHLEAIDEFTESVRRLYRRLRARLSAVPEHVAPTPAPPRCGRPTGRCAAPP
jgi:hypothetical protein